MTSQSVGSFIFSNVNIYFISNGDGGNLLNKYHVFSYTSLLEFNNNSNNKSNYY